MLKNYLRVLLRNMARHKGFAFINIAGLALGIACCLLILLWVQDELSFDAYHENAERIHRLVEVRQKGDGANEYPCSFFPVPF